MPSYPPGTIDKSYISSIHFLDQRDILNQVLDVTNEDVNFLDVMDQFKRRVPASSAKFHHYVNLPYYENITAPVGTNWDADDRLYDGCIITVVATQTTYYIKDATDVTTAIQLNGAPAALAGGEVVVVTSNAYGEGSEGPDPVRFGLQKYEAKAQIFKMAYELTDIELANKIEVEFNGQPYYMYKAQHDALLKYNVDISASMMFGTDPNSSFSGYNNMMTDEAHYLSQTTTPAPPANVADQQVTDATGNTVQFTRGMDSWARYTGFDQTAVTGPNSLDILATITKKMNTIRCPNNYMMIVGTEANVALDNDIKALNVTASATEGVGHRVDVSGRNVDLALDSFKLYGRNWDKLWMPMIDHEIGIAHLGTDHSKHAYFVPQDKIKVIGEDGAVDRMRVRYLEGPNMSFGYREIKLGGLAPVPTDSRSVFECVYESIQGLQVCGAEHFGIGLFG